jgi:hypothetical protein
MCALLNNANSRLASSMSLCVCSPVHHYDLYRLRGPEDMCNLNLADSFTRGATHARTHARNTRMRRKTPRASCVALAPLLLRRLT